MRVEVGIAGTDQIGSDAKPRWAGWYVSFQCRVVNRLHLRWIPVLCDDAFIALFSVQQIVEPLDHDSRGKIRQRDELVWNHVTIGVETSSERRISQAGLIGGGCQTFIGAQRVGHAARTNHTNSQGSARLIVSSHHHYGSRQQTELAGSGCI